MKIQMDTIAKTLKIEESVKLDKLVETLEKLLPDGEWKNYSLETHTVINNWNSPVIIREYPITRPWLENPWKPTYMANPGVSKSSLQSGVFNLKVED
jgi:hypothetical protein